MGQKKYSEKPKCPMSPSAARAPMWLSRRVCTAAVAAVAATTAARAPVAAIYAPRFLGMTAPQQQQQQQRAELARRAAEDAALMNAYNVQELELECQLEEVLTSAGDSGVLSSMEPGEAHVVNRLIERLESTHGRQQRSGWGQSESAYDLPYIGAWNVLYASEPSRYLAGGSARKQGLGLVSATQWIYGPGSGGAAAECVYAVPEGPRGGSLLVTRVGDVTKLPQAAVQLELSQQARAYRLAYTVSEATTVQRADGEWVRVERTRPTASPTVGELVAEGPEHALCAPSAGVLQTTYLSDVLWIVRDASGAATVLRRTEAEALKPQMRGGGPDGFDARRFGPSGRQMWMFDTGYDDREAAYQRARRRVRADAEISAS